MKSISVEDFIQTNDRLIVTDDKLKVTDCSCGCLESKETCPRQYTLRDVEKSATVSVTREISDYMDFALQEKRRSSQISCVASDDSYKGVQHHTDSGGYCLSAFLKLSKELGETSRGNVVIPFPDRTIPVPKGHAMADPIMINLLADFIEKEGITSFSDFGAGLGQYGMALERRFPDSLLYKAYDGAGDIEVYTQGFVKFFDFTIPLHLPVTDWAMSLEVGEHVPSDMEGMVIRNLHAHNCRGILLSWGVPGQGGLNHVNLHDSQYLIDIFEDLGYIHDVETTKHFRDSICPTGGGACWFKTSFLALRRKQPIC